MEGITDSSALSVVIIGRNEAGRLADAIKSVRSMNRMPDEIVYVDCGSTDSSAKEAAEAGVRVIEIDPEFPSPGLARNAGWRATSSPLTLFLDGDSTVHPEFVAKAEEELCDPQVGAVWGRVREKHPEQSIYQRILDIHWNAFTLPATGPSETCLGTALMRRDALEAVGGYRDGLIGWEESEMGWRMAAQGYRVSFVAAPMVTHDSTLTSVSQYWRRAIRSGYSAWQVDRIYGGAEYPYRARYRRFWRRSVLWTGAILGGLAATGATASFLPTAAAFAVLAVPTMQGAARARAAGYGRRAALAYGVHSWVFDIPFGFATGLYLWDRARGVEGRSISYK